MPLALPTDHQEAKTWTWSQFAPSYEALLAADLNEDSLRDWLADWSALSTALGDLESRLYVAVTVNTEDEAAEAAFMNFVKTIDEPSQAQEQALREKLLASGLSLPEIAVPLQQIQAAADLYREENIARKTRLVELSNEFDKLAGARTVSWKGEEVPLSALDLPMESPKREDREEAWTLRHRRIEADRAALNDLWVKMRSIRLEIAAAADKPSFVEYMYKDLDRFDYTPADVASFRAAILQEVVPAATRVYLRRAEKLGLDSLRPWDVDAPAYGAEPLRPYQTPEEFTEKAAQVFARLEPQLEAWFRHMDHQGLMDLFGRKGKADGGYCTSFPAKKDAYIFMNAVGTHDDLQTLFHEAGHCFHCYEWFGLPYRMQHNVGSEFCEVASMGMEMLCQAHLDIIYSPEDAARAQIQHLEKNLLFWPYMAMVDEFQHWAYENPEGANPSACDSEWLRLSRLYQPGIDWSGWEEVESTGWHRKLHIFQVPFYYVEYGLAQAGAMQVWLNSLTDEAKAVRQYREGLRLGCTVGLPQLFEAAGAKFAFDAETLGALTQAAEARIQELI
jgi:oligoendopeptidase F